jgi:predicted methyltransferase MtxX (methanogen marker protein 4)
MADEVKRITKIEKFGDEEIETVYRKAREPITKEEVIARQKIRKSGSATFGFCPELKTCSYILEDDILVEQDVPTTLSDGTIIYSDIYRPVGEKKVPVIISWSFFGKRPGAGMDEWQIMGVPPGTVSNMAKFESADPAYWCRQGYAVANVDPRGAGHSQGNIRPFGSADARDGYEYIEWLAQQHWCSGRIGMFGNSGVAMSQYRIAALQVVKTGPNTKTVSGLAVIVVPDTSKGADGVFVMADIGLNENPDAEALSEIAVASAESFRCLVQAEPVVALLSYSTYGSASSEMTEKVVEATRLARKKAPDVILDGELQTDAALVPEICEFKAQGSPVAGRANVLIFPDLNTGNISHKLLQRLGKAEVYGPITQGLAKPINDLSRGCSAEDIIGVIEITALQAQYQKIKEVEASTIYT